MVLGSVPVMVTFVPPTLPVLGAPGPRVAGASRRNRFSNID
jgi:hypothetical protein